MLALVLSMTLTGAEPEPPVILLKDVAKHVDKRVEISIFVRSVTQNARAVAMLNTQKNPEEKSNFSVTILRADAKKFEEMQLNKIAIVKERFEGKNVTAIGKIHKQGDKYEIIVKSHDDLIDASDSDTF